MASESFEWDDAFGVVIPFLAGILALIAFRAYWRTRTPRVLLFAAAFAVYFLKAIVLAVEILVFRDNQALDLLATLADLVVLVLFFLGMIKD